MPLISRLKNLFPGCIAKSFTQSVSFDGYRMYLRLRIPLVTIDDQQKPLLNQIAESDFFKIILLKCKKPGVPTGLPQVED